MRSSRSRPRRRARPPRRPRPGRSVGVPLPIKDLVETAGIRTTFSSRAFADYVPVDDMELVRRLKEAGFVVIGKTNTPEFGTTAVTESDLNGVCRNPWDTERTPGGSSGGAAAAVAAGLAPIAQGSDGGGSIRIPASCCGLFGLKPSRGRVSPAPRGDPYGLSVAGSLARTVADAAAFLDAIAGPVSGDPYVAPPPERPFLEEVGADPGHLRIGLALEPPHAVPVDESCVAAATDAAQLLEELGHAVEPVSLPQDGEALRLFSVVWATIPGIYPVDDVSLLDPLNVAFFEQAQKLTSIDYVRAYTGLQQNGRAFAAACAPYDVVLTPTLAKPPVPVGWVREPDDPWEQYRPRREVHAVHASRQRGRPARGLGPASSWTEDGLPIGIHLIGQAAGEAVLFRLAAQLEEARPWADRRPELG